MTASLNHGHGRPGRVPLSGPVPSANVGPKNQDPLVDRAPTDVGSGPAAALCRRFLEIAEAGFFDDYERILADDVVYLVPGRGPSAGLHRGRAAVVAALATPVRAGVAIDNCEATELIADGDRAVGIILLTGTSADGTSFSFEVAFHLHCSHDRILAITEYAGDQYTADELVRPDAASG